MDELSQVCKKMEKSCDSNLGRGIKRKRKSSENSKENDLSENVKLKDLTVQDQRHPLSEISYLEKDINIANINIAKICCFDWTNGEIWEFFKEKDEIEISLRSSYLFNRHPSIKPKMRTVLLDWMTEVCEVYRLKRETYYLSVDYLDRYLSQTENISKHKLQLIGITCLFIASKYEEIYPPRIHKFAYVTDGACTEEEINKTELTIMRVLDWKLTIFTTNAWLSVFLQLIYNKKYNKTEFVLPIFEHGMYNQLTSLLDLATLDASYITFSYRVMAVSAIYIACSKSLALSISSMEYKDIEKCVQQMSCFWDVLKDKDCDHTYDTLPPSPYVIHGEAIDFSHNYMKHTSTMEDLEKASLIASEQFLLTPPSSSKKITH